MIKRVQGTAFPGKAFVSPCGGCPKFINFLCQGILLAFLSIHSLCKKNTKSFCNLSLCINFRLSPFINNYMRMNNYFWYKACFCILHNFYELFHKVYGIQILLRSLLFSPSPGYDFVSLCTKSLPTLSVCLPELFAGKGPNTGLKYLVVGYIQYLLR